MRAGVWQECATERRVLEQSSRFGAGLAPGQKWKSPFPTKRNKGTPLSPGFAAIGMLPLLSTKSLFVSPPVCRPEVQAGSRQGIAKSNGLGLEEGHDICSRGLSDQSLY